MSKSKLIFLFYFFLLFICGLLFSYLLVFISLRLNGQDPLILFTSEEGLLNYLNKNQLLIMQLSSQVFSMILPAWLYTRMVPELLRSNQTHGLNLKVFVQCLLFFILSIPLVGFTAYYNQALDLPDWMSQNEDRIRDFLEKLLNFQSVSDLILAFVVIGIIPAIAEEWVFRGIIQNHLVKWFKNPWIGLLLTSILFSGIHMQFEGFIPRLILGFTLGFVYLTGKSLWYPILLHLINNGTQVIMVYFFKDEMQKQLNGEIDKPQFLLVAISSLLLALSGYFMYRESKPTC